MRADVLLAALAGDQVSYWIRTLGVPVDKLAQDLTAITVGLVGAAEHQP